MSAALHAAGIKLIVDIVPNHSSNRHEWFQEALAVPARLRRARALHLPRRQGRERRDPAVGLGVRLRRPRLGAHHRTGRHPRPVVPAHLRQGAAGPELGQPRSPRRLPQDPALLVRPRRGRLPRRRRPRAHQGPHRAAAVQGRAERGQQRHRRLRRRLAPVLGPRRGPRDLRRVARGLQRVQPAAHRRRRGVGPRQPPRAATPAPRAWARRSTSTSCRPTSTPTSSARSSPGTSPRPPSPAPRPPGCSPTTTSSGTPPATACPRAAASTPRARTARAGCWPAAPAEELDVELGLRRARAATLLMLALPGSAYLYQGEELGPAGGRGHPRRRAPGPHVLPQQGRGDRPRRLPRAAAVDRRGQLLRLRRRRRAPAAAGVVRPLRRRSRRTASRAPPWSSTARP